ncbi:MAG: hypothetical protein Q8O04_10045, partial [Deltaproteobacteria bacterium]|nr:hypothetical protein [Deltaproteobacteria bacterium]
PAARLQRTGNLRMQGKIHRIRSLTPLPASVGPGWQAAGNALAMHVQKNGYEIMIFSIKHVENCIISWPQFLARRQSVRWKNVPEICPFIYSLLYGLDFIPIIW